MLDFLKAPVASIQDFYVLSGGTLKSVFQPPYYIDDVFQQMDIIGVGSLTIVVLTSFASGLMITMQMARAAAIWRHGAGRPDCRPYAGRRARAAADGDCSRGPQRLRNRQRAGFHEVTEQIDAMRALGTDPIHKLVKPRVIATAIMLPCLTIIADFVGMIGGFLSARFTLGRSSNFGSPTTRPGRVPDCGTASLSVPRSNSARSVILAGCLGWTTVCVQRRLSRRRSRTSPRIGCAKRGEFRSESRSPPPGEELQHRRPIRDTLRQRQ